MKLDNEQKWPGDFWLPTTPDQRISGELTISKNGSLSLFLHGRLFQDNDRLRVTPVLHGNLVDCGAVTIFGCSENWWSGISWSAREPSRSPRVSTLQATECVMGEHFDGKDSIVTVELTFSCTGLVEWVGIHGFGSNSPSVDEHNLKYSSPKSIAIRLSNTLALDINFLCDFERPSEVHFCYRQRASVTLNSSVPVSIESMKQIATRIKDFLCLMTMDRVSFSEISFAGMQAQHCLIYFESMNYAEENIVFDPDWMLFTYRDLENSIGQILPKWLELYEVEPLPFILFFHTEYNRLHRLDRNFITIAQAIEGLTNLDETIKPPMPKDEFKVISEMIRSVIPPEHKFLKDAIRFLNKDSLTKRLLHYSSSLNACFGGDGNYSSFVECFKDARNSYTHIDPDTKDSKKWDGFDLIILTRAARAWFRLCCLVLIGLAPSTILSAVQSNMIISDEIRGFAKLLKSRP